MSLNEAEDIHVAKKAKLETLAPTLDQLKDHSAEEAAPQAKLWKKKALRTMCNMQEKTLADAHAKHLVSCLGDEFSVDVHRGALKLLAKLDPTTLAQHVPAFICCLSCHDPVFGVFNVLEKVEPAALAQHASAICHALNRYNYCGDDLIQVVEKVIEKLDSGMEQLKAKHARHVDRKRQRCVEG